MKKRFVLGNLIYYLDKIKYELNILLLNLVNFRRQIISQEILTTIIEIEYKINNGILLSDGENKVLNDLYNSKQVLQEDVLLKVEQTLLNEPELNIEKFNINALAFNLTHQCNFNCLYCYQNQYKDRPEYKQFMTIKDVDLIKEYLSRICFDANKIEDVVLSGGESLLPQNIDTINHILKNIKSNKFTIFTNGVNLFDYRKHIDYSLIDKFQISLDGTAEIIKNINQNSDVKNFEKIINGIKYIESLNKEISIVIMWTRELEQHIDEFIELLKQNDIIGKPNIRIRVNLIKDDYISESLINEDFYDLNYLCNVVKKMNQKLSQIDSFIEVYTEGATLNHLIHRTINKKNAIKHKRCYIEKTLPMTFEPNGEIFWCLCLGHENGRIGNYKDNKYFDKEKALKFGNRTIFKIEKCKNCELKYICAGGCPIPLTSSNKDLYQPVCGLYGLEEFWDRLEELV